MTLTDEAWLVIEGDSTTAEFQMVEELQYDSALTKNYLLGPVGEYVREFANVATDANFEDQRRTGYTIDGGGGEWQPSISFIAGNESNSRTWGDGSGGTGQGNVTTTDASGSGVNAVSKKQVLQYWLARSKSDSGGTTRIHHGEWSDGTYGSVGAHNQPMPVSVRETNFIGPDPNQEVDEFQGEITFNQVALWSGFDAPDWASDVQGAVADAAAYFPDA